VSPLRGQVNPMLSRSFSRDLNASVTAASEFPLAAKAASHRKRFLKAVSRFFGFFCESSPVGVPFFFFTRASIQFKKLSPGYYNESMCADEIDHLTPFEFS
jgi:hypothetical protein